MNSICILFKSKITGYPVKKKNTPYKYMFGNMNHTSDSKNHMYIFHLPHLTK